MRILFLSHYFPPEVNAPASRTHEHCRAWVQAGHEVHVLSNVPNHPAGKVYPGYHNRVVQREEVSGINVWRVLTFLAPNRGVLRRGLNYSFYLVMAVLVAPFLPRVDIVVSTSPQFFCGLAGYFVSRIKRVPWVLEIRDLWPESIVAVGAMRRSFTLRCLAGLAKFAYRKADLVLCVTDSFKTAIMAEGIPGEKIAVIKNGVDLAFYALESIPDPESAEIPGLGDIRGKFVAAYVGTHGMAHGLDTVLKAAALLRDVPDVVFLLVGDGAQREHLLQKRDSMKLDNVVMLEQQPKAMMPMIWAITGASLVVLRNEPTFLSVIPSKIFESMAMQRPIILGVRGESQALVEQSGAGICIQPENAEELAAAVRRLHVDAGERRKMGEAGRRFVAENFDRKMLAARYLDLLAEVIAMRSNKSRPSQPGLSG